jgi:tetratricopeptide (TPR) repeat protein
MKLRSLFPCVTVLAGLLAAQPAFAGAVTVLGEGLAHNCYKAAEFPQLNQDGIEQCTTALDHQALSPHDRASTYVNRGILLASAGRIAAALADYNSGLRLEPKLAEAYIDRGAALLTQKHYRAAITDFNEGLELGPRSPHIAYYDRAIARERIGDIRGAYHDYKKAVELVPNFGLARQQLSRFKIVHHHSEDDL